MRDIAGDEARLTDTFHAAARLGRGAAALNVYAKPVRRRQLPICTICDCEER
jgi:hypothetical protein